MTDTTLLILRVVVSLAIVVALLWFMARSLNRQPGKKHSGNIEIVSRASVSRHTSVVLLDVDGRRLLVGVADTQVTLLTELDTGTTSGDEIRGEGGDDAVLCETSNTDAAAVEADDASTREWGRVMAQVEEQEAPSSQSILAPSTWRSAWESIQGRK